jgi:hypothetical protein
MYNDQSPMWNQRADTRNIGNKAIQIKERLIEQIGVS